MTPSKRRMNHAFHHKWWELWKAQCSFSRGLRRQEKAHFLKFCLGRRDLHPVSREAAKPKYASDFELPTTRVVRPANLPKSLVGCNFCWGLYHIGSRTLFRAEIGVPDSATLNHKPQFVNSLFRSHELPTRKLW